MLRLVLLVVALTAGCQGDGDGSPPPPPGEARRVWAAHLDALRRQLMRDNYDYQHSDDDQQHRNTSGGAKLYYQRGETDHLSRASELSQGNSKVISSEHGPHEHYQQRAQQDRGRQREQWGEYQQRGEHEQLGQRAQSNQEGQRTQSQQRVQNQQRERGEQQQQIEQQHLVYKDSAEPSLADSPDAPRAAAPDELTARDLFEPEYTSDQRDVTPERATKYKPSNDKLQRDGYSPAQDSSVSDQRGNYNEQYRQDGESDSSNEQQQQEVHVLESDSQDSLNQEAIDQQESSWSEDNEKQRAIYDQFGRQTQKRSVVTRANRLQHHRNASPHHIRNSQSYRDDDASPDDDRYISKKDLPYFVSGDHLRRRNIVDVPDEDQPDRSGSSADSRRGRAGVPAHRRATTEPPGLPRTERMRHLFVTVSAANVTYELLTLKSRDGRRRGQQRVVEERGPEGVAIISLDEAPLPALRLPRSR